MGKYVSDEYNINLQSIQATHNIVYQVLTVDEDSRFDDAVLYFKVCDIIAPNGVGGLLFEDAIMNRREYKLPSYATVSRCRRKIFEEHPELKPSEEEYKARILQEEAMKEYAKEK